VGYSSRISWTRPEQLTRSRERGHAPAVWTRRHPERLHADFVGLTISCIHARGCTCGASVASDLVQVSASSRACDTFVSCWGFY
jgi:hypothetical protein